MWFYYLLVINILAGGLVLYDKLAAKRDARRIRERTLFLVSVLGGSPAMLLAMCLVRHKTRKPKFMLGIPLIIALQVVLVWYLQSHIF
jgi:uncharacterized membrane protein YsdA (DUF1294 family)